MARYGNYFLAFEADDDINIPASSRGTDFNNIVDDDTNVGSDGDAVDVTVSPNNRGAEFTDIEPDETNDTQTNDEVDADNQDNIELDDDTDFTDGIDEEEPDMNDTNTEDNADPNTEEENNQDDAKPGIEYSSTRKYKLYIEFENLIDTIRTITARLEKFSTNDIVKGTIVDKSLKKLNGIRDITTEHLTTKFDVTSYIQNMIFYNQIIASTKSVLDLLSEINEVDNTQK